jgi:hypothetical protein
MVGVNWPHLAGEFVAIVFAVLLALAVDNCASASHDRRLELGYLDRIRDDLEANSVALKEVRTSLETTERHGMAVLQATADQRPQVIDTAGLIASLLHSTFSPGWPIVRTATYTELISTGQLGLIRDSDVRQAIVEYYTRMAQLAGSWERDITYHRNSVRRLIPIETRRHIGDVCPAQRTEPLHCIDADPVSGAGLIVQYATSAEGRANLNLYMQQLDSWRTYAVEADERTGQLSNLVARPRNSG